MQAHQIQDPALPHCLTSSELPEALELWNRSAGIETPYKPLDLSTFESLFCTGAEGVQKVIFGVRESGRLLGFAAGNIHPPATTAYLTHVLVSPEARRRGFGTRLTEKVHESLEIMAAASGTPLSCLDARFLNPAALAWVVPGTEGHDHPNAPGVDVASPAYLFMKNIGYRDLEMVNSFHRDLALFEYSPSITEAMSKLDAEGLRLARYDASRHTGLTDLIDDLGSPVWRDTLLGNAGKPGGGLPVLIVEDGTRVCGFAGPMAVQESGRGYFNGIGIHSAYRKRGAGKVLFSALCLNLKEMGATFMTLFTGETNPARNIYESAGFRIVKVWACMRRTVH